LRRAARTFAATAGSFVGDLKRPWLIRRKIARRDLAAMPALASAEKVFLGFRKRVVE
jgi:hypothetical protein